MIRISGDFNALSRKQGESVVPIGLDPEPDIVRQGERLRDGLHLIVDDGSYEAEGFLFQADGRWYARIVPGTGRDKPE